MKRIIEELLFQMLTDQVMRLVYRLIECLNTMPWHLWFA